LEDIGIKIEVLKSNLSIASKSKNTPETPFSKDVDFKNYVKREDFNQIMEKVDIQLGKVDQID